MEKGQKSPTLSRLEGVHSKVASPDQGQPATNGLEANQSCPCPEASETQETGPEKAKKEQKNRVSVVGAAADEGRRLCEICGDQGYL